MPLGQQKAFYFADIHGNSKEYQEMINKDCNKLIPEHQKLSAGLFLITCSCKDKRIMQYFFDLAIIGSVLQILYLAQ